MLNTYVVSTDMLAYVQPTLVQFGKIRVKQWKPSLDVRISHQTAAVKSPRVKLPPWFELLAVSLRAADSLCPPLCTVSDNRYRSLLRYKHLAPVIAAHTLLRHTRTPQPQPHARTHPGARSVRMWPRCVLLLYLSACPTCVPQPVWVSGPGAERHLPEENKHDSLRWRHLPFESQRGCLNSCQCDAAQRALSLPDLRW